MNLVKHVENEFGKKKKQLKKVEFEMFVKNVHIYSLPLDHQRFFFQYYVSYPIFVASYLFPILCFTIFVEINSAKVKLLPN